jgi:hypothetical protein
MTLRLNGSTSGYTEIDAPAVAGSNTLVLPTGNGSADQALVTNGSGSLSFADRGRMTLATAQNSTSGTSIDFTGIPSWVKRVTVMFNGVSTSGLSYLLIQIGAGSVTSTGYLSAGGVLNTGGQAVDTSTSGFIWRNATNAATTNYGTITINLVGSNVWVASHSGYTNDNVGTASVVNGGGSVTLSGTLDRVRVTTVNGTDTFDAGSINILYEG